MLNNEQKFVIDLIRNNTLNEITEINIDSVLSILREHKIFIHYYNKISHLGMEESNNKVNNLYNIYSVRNVIYKNFLKELLKVLNSCKINYIIYKGLVLDILLYGDLNLRTYTDIDLIVEDRNIVDLSNILIKNFECTNIDNVQEIIMNREEIELNFRFCSFNFCVEIKTSNKYYIKRNMEECFICNIDNIPCKTFNYEYTLINLISHHYFMTTNIDPIKYSNRFLLQYLIDIKNLMINDKLSIDIFLQLINKYNMNQQLYDLIQRIREIFNNYEFGEIYLNNIVIDEFPKSLYSISVIDRYLNKDEIINFTKKYCLSYLSFDNNEYRILDKVSFPVCENSEENIELSIINKFLTIKFNNNLIKGNSAILICLYCYDIYGEFCTPYIPIVLKLIDDKCKFYIGWDIDLNSCIYNVNESSYKEIESIEKNSHNKSTIKLYLPKICFANSQGGINVNRSIAVNIHLLDIRNNSIVQIKSLLEKYRPPIKIRPK